MKLSLEKLLTAGLKLELPNDDGTTSLIDIERGEDVRGTYAQDPRTIRLDALCAAVLRARSARWHFGDGAQVEAAPLELSELMVDLRIARGELQGRKRTLGRIAARTLRAEAFSYASVARRVECAAATAEGLAIAFTDDGALEVRAAGIALVDARVRFGSVGVVAGSVVARGVLLRQGDAGIELVVAGLELRDVKVEVGETRLSVANVRAPSGFRLDRGAVVLDALEVDEAEVHATLPAPSTKPSQARATSGAPLDLTILDGLSGQLNADLEFDARIPVIKRRTATHRFRVPIVRGTIDFHELERDLSFLEDSVLDFKLKGDRLVFQKDIPLIPFDEETIVFWSLDAEEVALAEQDRVRLRRLARVERPEPKPSKSDEPSGFEILKLDVDPIEAALRLEGDARLDLGSVALRVGLDSRPAIGDLRISGAVRHRPEQPPQPGELKISASEIALAVERATLGGSRLSVDSVSLASLVDGLLTFSGVRPTAAEGTLRGLDVRGLRIEPSA